MAGVVEFSQGPEVFTSRYFDAIWQLFSPSLSKFPKKKVKIRASYCLTDHSTLMSLLTEKNSLLPSLSSYKKKSTLGRSP